MPSKSTPLPMITRVRLKNFRSIAECDVELGPLTILVGPNGSGKSNFVKALDFLADALNNGLESAIGRQGGMYSLLSRWALDDPDATLSIEIDMNLYERRRGHYQLELRRKSESRQSRLGAFELAREHCVVSTHTGRNDGALAEFEVTPEGSTWWDVRGVQFVPGIFPSLGPPSLTLPHVSEHLNFGLVHRALRGIACYSLHVSEMRKPQLPDGGELLKADGSNVASVYDQMFVTDSYGVIAGDRLLDWMKVIVPDIRAVAASNIAGYMALQFEQRSDATDMSWTFDASEISYGTLRTFGVLVALYQGRMRDISPVSLVGIEEPESAVHPGAATALLEAMAEASHVTQVLATTHSPAMLDHEDLDIGILCAVELRGGRTIIGPVDEASRQIVTEHLASAGELLRMRHISPTNGREDSPTSSGMAAPV
ncbi:MAG TPA: AAA family ATPase [Chloroflexota bacterium]|nr:AAA family ATPase [Chloroflexota bacterium]